MDPRNPFRRSSLLPRFALVALLVGMLAGAGFAADAARAQTAEPDSAQSESPETPAPETPETPEAAPAITVAEAVICTSVDERVPLGASETFPSSVGELYCFTDLRGGAEGATVVHAWIHEGETKARVELPVGGPRWRTWSSKEILPSWTGQWEVKILTADGAVLRTLAFTVE